MSLCALHRVRKGGFNMVISLGETGASKTVYYFTIESDGECTSRGAVRGWQADSHVDVLWVGRRCSPARLSPDPGLES